MIKRLSLLLLLLLSLFSSLLFADELLISPLLQADTQETEVERQADRLIVSEPRVMSELDVLLASSDPDYILRSGDIISVSYIDRAGASPVLLSLRVPYDGTIRIPGIASIETSGKRYLEVKSEIEDVILRYNKYSEPVVNLESLGVFSVTVRGDVEASRTLMVNGLYRLSDVLYLARDTASVRNVMVIDAASNVATYDLYEAINQGDGKNNPRLNPMDEIVFVPAERIVRLEGGVRNPGLYELKEGEELQALLANYSGGLSSRAGKLFISHVGADNYRITSEYSISSEVPLSDGDIVKVEEAMVANRTVSVVGALASSSTSSSNIIMGNKYSRYYYAFSEGETLADLVYALKDLLLESSDLENATLTRDGEVLDVDLSNILYSGVASDPGLVLKEGDVIEIPFTQMVVAVTGAVVKPGVYGYIPGKTSSYYINLAGGFSASAGKNASYTVKDKDGVKLDKDSIVTPESVINVETSSFNRSTTDTAAVLGIVASIVGIVGTTLGIILPQIY